MSKKVEKFMQGPFLELKQKEITPMNAKGHTPRPEQQTDYLLDPWIKENRFPFGNPPNEKAMEILNKKFPLPLGPPKRWKKGLEKMKKNPPHLREAEVLEVLVPLDESTEPAPPSLL